MSVSAYFDRNPRLCELVVDMTWSTVRLCEAQQCQVLGQSDSICNIAEQDDSQLLPIPRNFNDVEATNCHCCVTTQPVKPAHSVIVLTYAPLANTTQPMEPRQALKQSKRMVLT